MSQWNREKDGYGKGASALPTPSTDPREQDRGLQNSGLPTSKGNSMGDNISTYSPISTPWMEMMGKFREANPYTGNNNFTYGPNRVADLDPRMGNALNNFGGNALHTQGTGQGISRYGGANMGYGKGAPGAMQNAVNTAERGANALNPGDLRRRQLNPAVFESMLANDQLEGQIDAVSKDIMRNTYENTIPGLATSAVGTGSAYSTRTQHAYDRAMRDSREAVGDAAAGMRYQNFNAARQQTGQYQLANQQTALQQQLAQQQGYQTSAQLQSNQAQFLHSIGQSGVQNTLAGQNLARQGAQDFLQPAQYHQGRQQQYRDNNVAGHMFNQLAPFHTYNAYLQSLSPPAGMPVSYGSKGGGGFASNAIQALPSLAQAGMMYYQNRPTAVGTGA